MIQIPPPGISQASWDSWPIGERMAQLNRYLCDVLHVHEVPKGSNMGPVIDEALEYCGQKPGAPWCIAMQIYMAHLCGAREQDLPPKAIRASCHEVFDWAVRHGRESVLPRRGDLAIHLNVDGTGHAGCWLGPGDARESYRAIEGNTNNDGSREGWEMCRHTRPNTYARGYVRFWD